MRRREMRRAGGDDDEVETKVIPRRVDQSEKEMKRVRQELGEGGKDDSLTRSESVTQSVLKIWIGKPDLGMKLIASLDETFHFHTKALDLPLLSCSDIKV
jgi:hypothetical protein